MDNFPRNNTTEKFIGKEIFHISDTEFSKCRFKIIDHSTGDAECITHNGTHGIRLFPKHLWDIKDGIVYHRDDSKSQWITWNPSAKDNLTRKVKEDDVLS